MNKLLNSSKTLLNLLIDKRVATMPELKNAIGTRSRMTVFRKLKELKYLSSYSHSGKFYSLHRIARFNKQGIWAYNSVLFSKYGTLKKSIEIFINSSEKGYTANELQTVLKVKVDDVLLELIKSKLIVREKISGYFVYFSKAYNLRKQQMLFRKDSMDNIEKIKMSPDILLNELKAALIIFFSLLDEKERRLYAGLESLKVGHGGDKQIAELLDMNEKTVARGRKELLGKKVKVDSIREKGGGRKKIQKKNPRDHSENRKADGR